MSHALLTGFPGFIGRRLARHLLADDAELTLSVLVEERMAEAARAAATEIDGKRIKVLLGDISDRRLGLGDKEYDSLAESVRLVFHLAAIYNLAVPLENRAARQRRWDRQRARALRRGEVTRAARLRQHRVRRGETEGRRL